MRGRCSTNVFATNSICTPSRAAILTGQYSHLNGVTMFNRFDGSRMTVAQLLQRGGYYTGMIGKWHLGSDPAGFDRWEILPGQGAYFDPVMYTAACETTYVGKYATDVITDRALDFLDKRPRDKPFFLMMHHKAPHRPWEPDSTHAAHFATMRIPEPPTLLGRLRDAHRRAAREPAARREGPDQPRPQARAARRAATRRRARAGSRRSPIRSRSCETGGAWCSRAKRSRGGSTSGTCRTTSPRCSRWTRASGRCSTTSTDNGLARNTLVIYTSDQGFFLGDHGLFDKRFMYEESLRMPFLVRWPAEIKAGTVSDAIGLNVDFAPTFLDVAGLPPSAEMQGRSLRAVLRGRTPADWRTSMYYRYYHDPGDHNTRAHYGVRTRTHKLIYFWKKDQWELFDLANDPYEMHNLYGQPGHGAAHRDAQGGARAAQARGARRRSAGRRADPERRGRAGGAPAREVTAALWRRLDVPGHDACRLDEAEDGWILYGAAVFRLDGAPARLDYFVNCDRAWRARSASVEGWVGAQPIAITIARAADGRWLLDDEPVPGLDDCIDVDFGFTPATNVLQLRRVALAVGEAANVPVAWLDVPANTLERLEQRYHRSTGTTYDYESRFPAVRIPRLAARSLRDDYHAVLETTSDGFVRRYPGLWELED